MVPNMLTLIIVCMAAIAVHRIWNYEEIFAPLRASFGSRILIDPTWNALWIAPLVAAASLIPHQSVPVVLGMFAVYPLLRGLVSVYGRFTPECSPCEKSRKLFGEHMQEMRSFARRVIILGSDQEQANWLAQKHKDWLVILFGLGDPPVGLWKNVRYKKMTPTTIAPELQNTVFLCGTATVVVWGVTHIQPWAQAVEAHKNMKAVSWVHVGSFDPVMMPKHHTLAPIGESLDSAIDKAKAPA